MSFHHLLIWISPQIHIPWPWNCSNANLCSYLVYWSKHQLPMVFGFELRLGHTESDTARRRATSCRSRCAIYLYYTVLHYRSHTTGDTVVQNYKIVARHLWKNEWRNWITNWKSAKICLFFLISYIFNFTQKFFKENTFKI